MLRNGSQMPRGARTDCRYEQQLWILHAQFFLWQFSARITKKYYNNFWWLSIQKIFNWWIINLLLFLFIYRLFGNTGYCAACNKVIPAFEMVMRARSNVYHLECFACQQCNHRLVSDFFLNIYIWLQSTYLLWQTRVNHLLYFNWSTGCSIIINRIDKIKRIFLKGPFVIIIFYLFYAFILDLHCLLLFNHTKINFLLRLKLFLRLFLRSSSHSILFNISEIT